MRSICNFVGRHFIKASTYGYDDANKENWQQFCKASNGPRVVACLVTWLVEQQIDGRPMSEAFDDGQLAYSRNASPTKLKLSSLN
jgi:hypothetical protein